MTPAWRPEDPDERKLPGPGEHAAGFVTEAMECDSVGCHEVIMISTGEGWRYKREGEERRCSGCLKAAREAEEESARRGRLGGSS